VTGISPLADTFAAGPGFSPALDIGPGVSIGRFIVLERIGSGAMGVVFAAYDPQLRRKVALKAIHADRDSEQGSAGRARLVREAKAMALLSHPNVVTIYDVLDDGERAFVAMELVEGQSLRGWLKDKPRT
jgi:eukaryotic-like serine/threonine-protein kinase